MLHLEKVQTAEEAKMNWTRANQRAKELVAKMTVEEKSPNSCTILPPSNDWEFMHTTGGMKAPMA